MIRRNRRNLVGAAKNAAGLDWAGIILALEQRDQVVKAAQAFKAERDELLSQVARLKQRSPLGAAPSPDLWHTVGGNPQKQAQWLLQLYSDGIISFNTFEE